MADLSLIRLRYSFSFVFLSRFLSSVLFITFAFPAYSAENSGIVSDSGPDSGGEPQRWVVVPVVARTPEMGWLGGALLIHFFPADRPEGRASSLDLIAFGTTHKQFLIAFAPKIYTGGDRYRIQPSISWLNWKSNYYGIGSDSPDDADIYKSKSARGAISVTRFLDDCCFLKAGALVDRSRNEYEPGGRIDGDDLDGKDGGLRAGVSAGFGRDTREIGRAHV